MSMSTSVYGIKPPDDKWKKMKAAWDACKAAGVSIPDDIDDFFDGETPDEKGVVVDLEDDDSVSEYDDEDSSAGFEVDLRKLPEDVKIIRFVNSW